MSPWGWTPGAASVAPAPAVVAVRVGTGLQAVVSDLPTGGVIQLGAGTFYADASDHTIPLTLGDASSLLGVGRDATIIGSPILGANDQIRMADFTVRPTGGAYGIKLYRSGSSVSRSRLERLRIGASAEGAGDGPAKGIWLDGAILCDIVQCTSSFNTHSNIFIDTTDTLGTNLIRILGCTLNGATRYGLEVVGGSVQQVHVHGGNIESNTLGGVTAANMNDLQLIGVDFENAKAVSDLILVSTSNPVTIQRCTFLDTALATRAFQITGSSGVFVGQNRFSGFNAGVIGVLDVNTTGWIEPTNLLVDGLDRILAHRGRMVFA